MWESLEETRTKMEIVENGISIILDSVRPGEIFKMTEFREALIELCQGRVTLDYIDTGILDAFNNHKVEFTKFMLEVQSGDDTWDNRLSGIKEDDERWMLSVKRSLPVRKVA